MPSPWANLVVGGPILPDSYFGGGFSADFTKPLDGGTNAGGILGTTSGHDGDPFNFTYPTDGQFKVGGYLQFHQTYATGYSHPYTSNQRNKETQHYVHFHDKRGVADSNPDPMSFFELRDGKLVMKSRPVTAGEQVWSRIKGYAVDENAKEATYGWFAANGGIPAEWAPLSLTGQDTEPVLFFNLPAPYACTMISTLNRASMSFGRSRSRIMVPSGARNTGSLSDVNDTDVWFPAFWDLEDVPALCDINGRPITDNTITPGNPGAGGVLNELDQAEIFGYEQEIHQTSHYYDDGGVRQILNSGGTNYRATKRIQTNHTPPYPAVRAVKGQFIEPGVDRFPPYQGQPGVICYHVNGIVTALLEMPDYLGQPKIVYEPLPDIPWLPLLNENYTVKRLGHQTYASNDQPAYTHFFQIWNTAMNAGFVRTQAVSALQNATAPAFVENEEFIIEWTEMSPLLVENPDSIPFIDYKAGDVGGSGPTIGEIIDPSVGLGGTTAPTGKETAKYTVVAQRPNGKDVLVPVYDGDPLDVLKETYGTTDGPHIDPVSRSATLANKDSIEQLQATVDALQLQIAMLIDRSNWNLIEDGTASIKADLYRIGALTAPLTISEHHIGDGESARIIDLSGITATNSVTLDLGGTVSYNLNGALQTIAMPLVLDTGITDLLLIRSGANWFLNYHPVEGA